MLCPTGISIAGKPLNGGDNKKIRCLGNLKANRIVLFFLFALAVFFLPCFALHAQTGLITGTVVDPSGAAIPGAQIQIINQATGDITRNAITDSTGTFRALNVPPSTYKIRITAPGMEELDRNGVVLDQEQTLGLGQLQLTIGQTSQTVTVNTGTPLIDTATSNNSAVIDQRQVLEQPLNFARRSYKQPITVPVGL
jgi:hypothetical protein